MTTQTPQKQKDTFTKTGFNLSIRKNKNKEGETNTSIRKNLMKQLFISVPETISDEIINEKRIIELKFNHYDTPFYLIVDNKSNKTELLQSNKLLSDQTEVCEIILNKVS